MATMVATGLAGLTATPGVVLMVVASHAFKDEMIMVPTPVVVLGFAGIVAGLVLVSVAFGVAAQLGLRYDGAGLVGVVYGSCVAGVGGCLLTIHGGSGTAGQLAEGMLVAGLTTVGLLMSNAARADFKRSDSVVPSL
ncbi:MAG: hypothetical protein JO246_02990 [Frankiaceae bacterium]|nr:hypothetical protein [Frankiaceae bacterium]MBV9870861.1 hypothetical protein [Frankiaceae bacterium]